MRRPIYRVVSFDIVAPYTLEVWFDDVTSQRIDFEPILHGELLGPLRDQSLFRQVTIDPEVQTLVWPNVQTSIQPLCTTGRTMRERSRTWRAAGNQPSPRRPMSKSTVVRIR